jgi:elongation factor 1-alpha
MAGEKQHLSIVICGHVDSGKSTTTGRLLFELGGIPEREMEKLKAEAERLGKQSFAFAFYMDRQKEERERGVTIACTTKEFYTEKWHYTIIDAPGHRDFIKNMITGASQADVALLMVPADGNFVSAIARGNHKAGEIQGQTRQHARLINLLGVKQLVVGINKMDCDVAKYEKSRYDEIKEEMKSCLIKTGWKKDFIEKCVPILPISGWIGDNLLKKSDKMAWWEGQTVQIGEKGTETLKINTLQDALNDMVRMPERKNDAPMRMPVSGVYKIKGVGDVITGRVEQGVVKPGEEVVFLPTHTAANACAGKVFTCEMHHKRCDDAKAGDNVGLNVKGLNKDNMPRTGDVMVYKKDGTLREAGTFTAQVQILDHPGELKVGYTPVCFVRTGRSAVRMKQLVWKMGKETGGKKAEEPHCLKANEMAEVVFAPQQPLVVDSFKNCEGLSRVAIMEGNGVVMLGKVISTTEKTKEDAKKKK